MLYDPVPMSKKSCPVALVSEILIVISPGAPFGRPILIVFACPPLSTTGACNPVALFVKL